MDQLSEQHFASELRSVINRLIKKIRKESPAGQKFSLTERSVMALLEQHKALLPSELAAMEMITNQSMSQVLNNLFKHRYIIRVPSETDKRKVNILLSDIGLTALYQLRHERDEWLLKAMNAVCTPDEKELLKKVIVPVTKMTDYKQDL